LVNTVLAPRAAAGSLGAEASQQRPHVAARFTLEPGTASLRDMEAALKPHDNAKWTIVTYLPFLWLPEAHMFLKPEVTKDFAARVGHRFAADYEARLQLPVYQRLLELVVKTEAAAGSDRHPELHLDHRQLSGEMGGHERRGAGGATMRISTLLDHIDDGHITMTELQRGYVWNRDQVRGLFEWLYRRNPVGSLLVWVTEWLGTQHRGDGVRAPGVAKPLVDGQQRMTSICGIVRGRPPRFRDEVLARVPTPAKQGHVEEVRQEMARRK